MYPSRCLLCQADDNVGQCKPSGSVSAKLGHEKEKAIQRTCSRSRRAPGIHSRKVETLSALAGFLRCHSFVVNADVEQLQLSLHYAQRLHSARIGGLCSFDFHACTYHAAGIF